MDILEQADPFIPTHFSWVSVFWFIWARPNRYIPMAGKSRLMSQIKQFIRLHREDYPIKTIARHLSISKNTVKSYLKKLSDLNCRKVRRRLPARVKQPLSIPERPLKTWSLDFMSDVLTNKRKFRTLNIIDDFNKQAIAIEVAHSMPANKVTYLLERIIKEQGKPSRFRTDNGPEFISREFRDWCAGKEIEIQYIQPGRPMQNGYIERFNRTFRESILDAYLFEDTQQVQILAEEWIQDYNYRRPHESLGGKTLMEYDALPAACYQ
ncbi:IS3 family transposase [Sphingobacterium kyonggiense]